MFNIKGRTIRSYTTFNIKGQSQSITIHITSETLQADLVVYTVNNL